MKVAGRKTSSAYELYGFIPKVDNGKHSAICMSCNRVLQNTAAIRLQKHRNSCVANRATSGDQAHFPNAENKRLLSKPERIQQIDSISSNVKTELSNNIEFDDDKFNDNTNDNSYGDTVEPCITLYQEENPIKTPVTTHQPPSEPFEHYNATNNNTNNSLLDTDNEIQELDDEDLNNIEQELDVIQNLMPRSKESKQLQDELAKAETEYYRCKTAYVTKLTENCKIKRTLMLLESRKLQLEIEKLTNDS